MRFEVDGFLKLGVCRGGFSLQCEADSHSEAERIVNDELEMMMGVDNFAEYIILGVRQVTFNERHLVIDEPKEPTDE